MTTKPPPSLPAAPRRRIACGLLVVALALAASPVRAQGVADHLQCFKVTDATRRRLKGLVDLDAPSIGVAPGCRLGRAKLYCVPARAVVQPGTLFDGSAPLAELPYHGRPAGTDRICHDVSCRAPAGTAADQTATDRFGTRVLARPTTAMVCTPATGGTLPPPATGFQLKSPPIELPPGANITYCWYFRTPNAVTVPVKRFVSALAPGTQSVVMFTTTSGSGLPADRYPPGTVSTVDCGRVFGDGIVPRWVYAGDTASTEMALPADDGAGHPLALEIPANSSGFLMMHHRNTTPDVIRTSVTVNAEALESPVYTTTETFAAYTGDIAIPPMTTGHVEGHECAVPAGAQLWRLSTRTHRFAVRSEVRDGADVLFETLDWEHPGARTWLAPPFRTFASAFGHGCTYDNPTTLTIRTGPSQQYEEECVAVGYFFPATRPRLCLDGYVLP